MVIVMMPNNPDPAGLDASNRVPDWFDYSNGEPFRILGQWWVATDYRQPVPGEMFITDSRSREDMCWGVLQSRERVGSDVFPDGERIIVVPASSEVLNDDD